MEEEFRMEEERERNEEDEIASTYNSTMDSVELVFLPEPLPTPEFPELIFLPEPLPTPEFPELVVLPEPLPTPVFTEPVVLPIPNINEGNEKLNYFYYDIPIFKGALGEQNYPGNESGDVAISPNGELLAVTGVNSNSPILLIDVSEPSAFLSELPNELARFYPGWYSQGIEFIDDNILAIGSAINGLKLHFQSLPNLQNLFSF